MNLQVLRPRKQFPATGERTRKGFLARMHPQMVNEFVLGFERETGPWTFFPVADVFRGIVQTDVVLRQMLHNVHHDEELFTARFTLGHLVCPHARYHLVERLPEVTVRLITTHVHVTVRIVPVVVVRRGWGWGIRERGFDVRHVFGFRVFAATRRVVDV